jgi:hypothetical protein
MICPLTTSLPHACTPKVKPFMVFGADMRSHYNGTIFRFPLRSTEQAAHSRISKQVRMVIMSRF